MGVITDQSSGSQPAAGLDFLSLGGGALDLKEIPANLTLWRTPVQRATRSGWSVDIWASTAGTAPWAMTDAFPLLCVH